MEASEKQRNLFKINNFTLRFEDVRIEKLYAEYSSEKQRQKWLRTLFLCSLFQILLHCSDMVQFPSNPSILKLSSMVRVCVSLVQIAFFVLLYLNLITVDQNLALVSTVLYAIPTIFVHALPRSELSINSALFLVYGLGFYIVPKMSPLRFLHSSLGSIGVVMFYFWLAIFLKPPSNSMETLISILLTLPPLFLFNYSSYASERASRERYLLNYILKKEHGHEVKVALSRNKQKGKEQRWKMFIGVGCWIALLLLPSLPSSFKSSFLSDFSRSDVWTGFLSIFIFDLKDIFT